MTEIIGGIITVLIVQIGSLVATLLKNKSFRVKMESDIDSLRESMNLRFSQANEIITGLKASTDSMQKLVLEVRDSVVKNEAKMIAQIEICQNGNCPAQREIIGLKVEIANLKEKKIEKS